MLSTEAKKACVLFVNTGVWPTDSAKRRAKWWLEVQARFSGECPEDHNCQSVNCTTCVENGLLSDDEDLQGAA